MQARGDHYMLAIGQDIQTVSISSSTSRPVALWVSMLTRLRCGNGPAVEVTNALVDSQSGRVIVDPKMLWVISYKDVTQLTPTAGLILQGANLGKRYGATSRARMVEQQRPSDQRPSMDLQRLILG